MIHLTTKSAADVESFLSTMWVSYLEDVIGAGFTPEEASENVERNKAALFVDGVPNDDQHFFDVMDDETPVGTLWLAERREGDVGEWFVYDIEIDEEYRGRGLGRHDDAGRRGVREGPGWEEARAERLWPQRDRQNPLRVVGLQDDGHRDE